jgi:hypothetical protein
MSNERFSRDEIVPLLALNQDQLYAKLVSPDAGADLNHPGALIARGKGVLVEMLRKTRGPVCDAYRSHKDTIKDAAELVALVAGAMIGAGMLHETVLPAAVLVIKIGLEQICPTVEDTHATG